MRWPSPHGYDPGPHCGTPGCQVHVGATPYDLAPAVRRESTINWTEVLAGAVVGAIVSVVLGRLLR